MNEFQTEFEFLLPKGYLDATGTIHREGTMRLSTAADEILPLKDPRVISNSAYLVVILLSRVVTRLGSLDMVNPKIIEGLFAADLAYLQDFYNRINSNEQQKIDVVCPQCNHSFSVELEPPGES
jgi:hypothetical protein